MHGGKRIAIGVPLAACDGRPIAESARDARRHDESLLNKSIPWNRVAGKTATELSNRALLSCDPASLHGLSAPAFERGNYGRRRRWRSKGTGSIGVTIQTARRPYR
jgi:hypothetical protein